MPARTYEIRISGLAPTEQLVDALREVDVVEHELRTVLSGAFEDHAALYGFLHLLRSYGLEVVEVRRVPGVPPEEPEEHGVG